MNVFQNTIERTGAWVGRCAELCGTFHSAMNFEVRGVPQAIYDEYIHLRETVDPATGVGYTAAAALAKLQTEHPGLRPAVQSDGHHDVSDGHRPPGEVGVATVRRQLMSSEVHAPRVAVCGPKR